MRSAWFISPHFLERIAEPASPLHSDYLTYRKGEITGAELIASLPHVAMLGDSVCILHLIALEHVLACSQSS